MNLQIGRSYLIRGTASYNCSIEKITVIGVTKTCFNLRWETRDSWELIEYFNNEYEIIEDLGKLLNN